MTRSRNRTSRTLAVCRFGGFRSGSMTFVTFA
ncbi:MAG: hypothetical protein RLZZ324_828, partial [Candidatus Parcubacteria bacterium]